MSFAFACVMFVAVACFTIYAGVIAFGNRRPSKPKAGPRPEKSSQTYRVYDPTTY